MWSLSGNIYSKKVTLKQHMLTHTKEKPFECEVWKKKFSHKCSLNRHVRSHTGDIPFGCDVCHRRFRHKSSLNDHKRIHTGDRPFECKICEHKVHIGMLICALIKSRNDLLTCLPVK